MRRIALVTCLFTSTLAHAGEVAVIGVYDAQRPLDAQVALSDVLAKAIDASGEATAVRLDQPGGKLAGREDVVLEAAYLRDARRQVDEGRRLWQQAEGEDATAALNDAIDSFAAAAPWVVSARDLWDARMLLASVRLSVGDDVGARDAVMDALAVRPDRRPDPAAYPPELLAVWEEEHETAVSDTCTVVVEAVGALESVPKVWIDGRGVGDAPATVSDLAVGSHLVTVRSADGLGGFVAVDALAGAKRTLKVPLTPLSLGKAKATPAARSQQVASLLRALGESVHVDGLLLVGRDGDSVVVQLYAPDSDAFTDVLKLSGNATDAEIGAAVTALVRTTPAAGGTGASAAASAAPLDVGTNLLLARALLAPHGQTLPTVAVTPVKPPKGAPSHRPRWPVWVGVGVGSAVAIVTGTVLGVLLGGRGSASGETSGTIVVLPPAP